MFIKEAPVHKLKVFVKQTFVMLDILWVMEACHINNLYWFQWSLGTQHANLSVSLKQKGWHNEYLTIAGSIEHCSEGPYLQKGCHTEYLITENNDKSNLNAKIPSAA